jgi:probable rRNA maturation factor
VSIEVCNESGVALDESLVASVARHALDAMRVNPAAELSILAVTSEVMAELHERWMDEPGPTDVMSFPMDELADESRRPGRPGHGSRAAGDIVLCRSSPRPRPARPVTRWPTSCTCSPCTACCTCSATDHAEPDQEREMFGLQNRLLREWRTGREQAAARRRSAQRLRGAGTVGLCRTRRERLTTVP